MGGGVGRWPMEGGQGGEWGGGHQRAVWEQQKVHDLAGDEGPWRAGKGGVGATKGALVPPFWLP